MEFTDPFAVVHFLGGALLIGGALAYWWQSRRLNLEIAALHGRNGYLYARERIHWQELRVASERITGLERQAKANARGANHGMPARRYPQSEGRN